MARKYVKSFIIRDTSEYESGGIMDHEESESLINKWLEEKYLKVGQNISNFEMLDIKLAHVPETTNTIAYTLLLVIYTELRL